MNLTLKNKGLSKGLSIIGIAALCALSILFAQTLFPTNAYARSVTFSIPVEQIFEVTPEDLVREGAFNYEMRRLSSAYPFLAEASGDVYSFTLTGDDTRSLGPLTFTHAGQFRYEIKAVGTAEGNYIFDDTIYTAVVIVTNTPDGRALLVTMRVYIENPDGSGGKLEVAEIVFAKGYEGEVLVEDPPPGVLPDPPPTPPGQDPPPPPPGAGVTRPSQGPKTGDYADPIAMLFAMGISAVIALFVVFLIYTDRKNDEDYGKLDLATTAKAT